MAASGPPGGGGGRSMSNQPPQQHQQGSPLRRRDDEDVYNQYRFAPYLRNLRQLTIHDEEYHRMAYLLRASLASLSVKIISIHAVNSPQQDAIFESNHIGTTTLDSWVNGTDLPEQNSIHNIITHGGRFRITDADKGAPWCCAIRVCALPCRSGSELCGRSSPGGRARHPRRIRHNDDPQGRPAGCRHRPRHGIQP